MKAGVTISLIVCASLLFLTGTGAYAQTEKEMTPQQLEQQKKLMEGISAEVDRLAQQLDLDVWQVFYVDSIMTHDYVEMQNELNEMSAQKISNISLYQIAQYRWQEKIYNALHQVFDEQQWAKYLKTGAGREKKARDKALAKLEKTE